MGEKKEYYDAINRYPSVKEYEDWKKENEIDLESVLKGGLENEYRARDMIDEKFQTIVKNKKAWYMAALRTTAVDEPFLKYNILDELVLGWFVWNDTKSVTELYKTANLRWSDPLVAGNTYEEMIYFLKANGEFVDADNKKAKGWCQWRDDQFDVDKKIQKLERDVMLNKDGELLRKLTNAGRDAK